MYGKVDSVSAASFFVYFFICICSHSINALKFNLFAAVKVVGGWRFLDQDGISVGEALFFMHNFYGFPVTNSPRARTFSSESSIQDLSDPESNNYIYELQLL